MQTFCSNCGTALPPSARFCSSCGTVVSGAPPAGSQPYGSQPYGAYPPYPYPNRLLRPIFGRQFAGVCIGLARNYNWDVSVVRILTVLGGIFIFPVVEIAYIACWIGIPEETLADVQPMQQPVPPPPPSQVERA